MYNHALDTFVRAAELGSFSKVAEESFISPSAVIQQMNHLEKDLNVRLFNRSKKGITLTQAGQYLLLESRAIIQRSNDVCAHLSLYEEHPSGAVLFGSNHFHMPRLIYDYWPGFAAEHSGSTLSSYSFNESGSDIRPNTDLIEGIIFEEPVWQGNFTFHPISNAHLAFMVREDSPLAEHQIITEVDLQNYTLINIKRGISKVNDRMQDDLLRFGLSFEEVEIYSTSILIDSLEAGKPVMIPDCWKDLHPKSKTIPFIKNYEYPYGFFLSKSASGAARKFLAYVLKTVERQ